MTNIAYLSGIIPGNEPREFSRTIAPAAAIDPLQLTKGEMQIALLAEQLRVVGTYYDNKAQIQEAQRLLDILARGLHVASASDVGSAIPAVNAALRRARRKLTAATSVSMRRSPGQTLTEAALSGITGQAGIGEVLIPFHDCNEFIKYNPDTGQDEYQPGWGECAKIQDYVRMLNDKLTPMSHHLLYEYAATTERGPVQTKRVLHKLAVDNIATITGLDVNNFRMWLRNGIIKNNMRNGTEAFQPEDTIYILKTSAQEGVGVVPLTAVIAAIGKIIGAITAAIAATVAMVNALRNPDRFTLDSRIPGFTSESFSPNKEDFEKSGSGSGNGNGNGDEPTGDFLTDNKGLLIPAAAALAVLLIAK